MLVLCDLDGTLADISHRLHYLQGEKKDWDSFYEACDKDILRGDVACRIHAHRSNCDQVIFCSGRRASVFNKTGCWLHDHYLGSNYGNSSPYFNFYSHKTLGEAPCLIHIDKHFMLMMRRDNDYRKDHIIKQEMLRWIQKHVGQPDLVYDDRRSVLGMWQMNGIKVINCSLADNNDF